MSEPPYALRHPTRVTITCEFPDGAVWTLSSVAPAMEPSLHVTEIQDQRLVGLARDPFQAVRVTGLRRDAVFTVQGIDEFTITHPGGPSPFPMSYEMKGSAMTNRTIEELIEASSLGTPEAKRLRASVSPEAVAKVMARVKQLPLRCPYCSGRLEIQESDLGELECFVCSGCRAAWDKDGDGIDPPERRT